ncbi:hypothetical protein [Bacillus cereus]|uniref:hypothetical protein n=1 Tax=Bacillus cereus TaxID=1396 RepID=UPI00397F2E27
MINKTWKKVIWIIIGIVITYFIAIIVSAASIPSPSKQQLEEAQKVTEHYISENNGVEIIVTSKSFINEMFNRTIQIEGYSKENPKRVFRVDLAQIKKTSEEVTEKSINRICISNDEGKNFKCNDVK